MLYLDYSRRAGEWVPNVHGGRENLDAVAFLRQLNEAVYRAHPDVQTIAEESTAWPKVSRPTYARRPRLRPQVGHGLDARHARLLRSAIRSTAATTTNELTFRMLYAFSENFVLPLSHDEVVHGKGSLLGKMPGDDWQKFANLRLLFGYMWAQPGKKLLFMGGEFGQWREWNHDASLDWHLLRRIRRTPACSDGCATSTAATRARRRCTSWTAAPTASSGSIARTPANSVIAFLRKAPGRRTRGAGRVQLHAGAAHGYRLGVPRAGRWREVLNSDAAIYGGSGMGNCGGVDAAPTRRRTASAIRCR